MCKTERRVRLLLTGIVPLLLTVQIQGCVPTRKSPVRGNPPALAANGTKEGSGLESMPERKSTVLFGRKFSKAVSSLRYPPEHPLHSKGFHSIKFSDENFSFVDDGSTWWGNPPESGTYEIKGPQLTLHYSESSGPHSKKNKIFHFDEPKSRITNESNEVFTLTIE